MAALNKTELIKEIASQTGLTQREVTEVLEAFIDKVVSAVSRGEDVSIYGLGKFYRHTLKERTVRVPGTDKVVRVGGNVPRFRAAKAFKEAVK